MITPGFGEVSALAVDLDGTLANTVPTHNAARLEAFDWMAVETMDHRFSNISEAIHADAHRHGSNPVAIIGWVLQEAGIVTDIEDKRVKQTVDLKKQIYADLAANGLDEMPGATGFLKRAMRAWSNGVAIVTTAHRDTEAVPFLRRHGLEASFPDSRLITHEDVGPDHMKPDPMAYQLALQRFELTDSPELLLAIEDSAGGITAARALGVRVVGIATTHTREELDNFVGLSRPDYIVDNFDQLHEMCGILSTN